MFNFDLIIQIYMCDIYLLNSKTQHVSLCRAAPCSEDQLVRLERKGGGQDNKSY